MGSSRTGAEPAASHAKPELASATASAAPLFRQRKDSTQRRMDSKARLGSSQ
jgi:hypothetical protein